MVRANLEKLKTEEEVWPSLPYRVLAMNYDKTELVVTCPNSQEARALKKNQVVVVFSIESDMQYKGIITNRSVDKIGVTTDAVKASNKNELSLYIIIARVDDLNRHDPQDDLPRIHNFS